ncbi:glycosyltransferase family 4 protein [Caulobacter sp. S45]|uniref:glycosyltransferase family 4 protein n=1 Tax=Caulobacter sp. S45 TaxID=1641861 RepID=UPI0015755EF2|nr:glycosyltransferase family 4 protein [Caulobacter sp. S45]
MAAPPSFPPGACVLQATPALDSGGVEQTTLDMAQAITTAGGVALVASAGGRLEPELARRGGELVRMPLDRKAPWTLLANAARLERLIRARGVDIVHARSRAPAWSALLAARRTGAAFVTTYHGVYNARSGLKRAYNRVMARGDVVIANSAFTAEHLLAEHPGVDPGRVVTIPRGVDLAGFSPERVAQERVTAVRAAWGLAPDDRRPVALLAARLTAWKGQRLLIEALAQLRGHGDLVLVLAGDDQGRTAYTESLRSAAAEAGLSERVRIVGHCTDMAAGYLAADFACAPSLDPEAFGRTAVEPQAMGRPVLAADHGAVRETVEEGVTGWRVAPGDADAWAAALGWMLDTPADARVAMGAAGRERVERLYSLEAMTMATLGVYARLLAERRR